MWLERHDRTVAPCQPSGRLGGLLRRLGRRFPGGKAADRGQIGSQFLDGGVVVEQGGGQFAAQQGRKLVARLEGQQRVETQFQQVLLWLQKLCVLQPENSGQGLLQRVDQFLLLLRCSGIFCRLWLILADRPRRSGCGNRAGRLGRLEPEALPLEGIGGQQDALSVGRGGERLPVDGGAAHIQRTQCLDQLFFLRHS